MKRLFDEVIKTKIYQIHVCSGEWEDYSDTIFETYLQQSSAESRLEQLNNELKVEEDGLTFCKHCPINSLDFEKYPEGEYKKRDAIEYCVLADLEWNEYGEEYLCNNMKTEDYNVPSYHIKEVDVIEG